MVIYLWLYWVHFCNIAKATKWTRERKLPSQTFLFNNIAFNTFAFSLFRKKNEACEIILLSVCLCLSLMFFVFYAVCVVSKESRRLVFPPTFLFSLTLTNNIDNIYTCVLLGSERDAWISLGDLVDYWLDWNSCGCGTRSEWAEMKKKKGGRVKAIALIWLMTTK
jgi:hypothetical protein